jgi:tetratricopeptide (TPR) repeat protein
LKNVQDLLEDARNAYRARDFAAAELLLSRAAEVHRDVPEVQHLLGNASQELGKLDRAISCYRRALRLNPQLAEAHNDLGTAYFSKGWYREAADCYTAAIRLQPAHHVAHANAAEALMKLGEYPRARKHIRSALLLRIRAFLRRAFLRR